MKLTKVAMVAIATAGLIALGACGSDNNSSTTNGAQAAGTTAGGNAKPNSVPTTDGAGAGSASPACATGSLQGTGSSFQADMESAWSAAYGQACSGAKITYEKSGSGAGISSFGNGTVDFAGSDVAMKDDELSTANTRCAPGTAVMVPVTAGGIAIEYNVPGVDKLNLSAATLAKIFTGKVSNWNDAAIAAENSGASLPNLKISVVHRSDGSGSTQVFSEFLAADAGSDWSLGSGKEIKWPTGQGAKGSDGVTTAVKSTKGGIGYAELSYATGAGLPTAAIKGAGSDFVALTSDSVTAAIDGFTVTGSGSLLTGKVDYATATGYPISTVSYAIACSSYKDSAKSELVKNYLSYAVGPAGQAQAADLGFAPLPTKLTAQVASAVATIS